MIQEPISDLQKILGEPVDEVTGEHLAIADPAGKRYRDSRQEHSGRTPCLRPRLTVRLVALKPENVITPLVPEPQVGAGPVPVHATPTDGIAADGVPVHEVPARVFVAAPFLPAPEVETELAPVRTVPMFSGPYTPEPDAHILTPEPEGNDDAENDDAGMGEFYPYLDTPTPEPGADSDPYTPAPENDGWLYQASKLRTNSVSLVDSVQPILLPTKPATVESVRTGLTPAPAHVSKRYRRFDPALTLLTFLLLLGILGGIGFGYLLTIVYQG